MPPYKKQHYLPTAYLKYFSADQRLCSRDSWIWRFDGNEQRQVAIVSQCSGDYHFSKEKAAETEAMFQPLEAAYCNCVDGIKTGRSLNENEYGQLLLAMFDFQLRSDTHQNLTGKEGIEAYHMRSRAFMRDILLGKTAGEPTQTEIIEHVRCNWSLRILSPVAGKQFITSDNPASWMCLWRSRPPMHVVMLPLTPTHLAFAFDKRVLEVVSNQVTLEDELTLNCSQLQNASRCVFSANQLTDEQMARIRTMWEDCPPRSRGEVDEAGWKLSIQGLKDEHRFSFIRLTPPLM